MGCRPEERCKVRSAGNGTVQMYEGLCRSEICLYSYVTHHNADEELRSFLTSPQF